MTTPATPQKLTVQQLEQFAATQLAQRVKRDDVIRAVIQYGVSAPEAIAIVSRAERMPKPATPAQARSAAPPRGGGSDLNSGAVVGLIWGGILLVGGIIATSAGYSSAASQSNGGTYTVYYGAIIIGAIRIIVSLFRLHSD